MTAPLTPADCDLRDFGFMPLDVRRFRDSDLVSNEDPEAIVAAIMLWGAAWHQVPAASLPDDDRTLANLAGYGKVVKEWLKVKDGALRGFVTCDDGRLYHPVVAAKAREAWDGKLRQRHRTFAAAIRKHNERHKTEIVPPSFEQWLKLNRPDRVALLDDLPQREPDLPFEPVDNSKSHTRQDELSRETKNDVTRDKGLGHANVTRDMASKGEGQGEGQGEGDSNNNNNTAPKSTIDDERPDLMGLTSSLANAAGVSIIQPSRIAREMDVVKGWVKAGIDPDEVIRPVIARRLIDMAETDTVSTLAYFDASVRKAHALASRKPKRSTEPARTINAKDSDDPRVPRIRSALKAAVGEKPYSGWLSKTATAFLMNGTSVTLKTTGPFARDWITENYGRKLDDAVAAIDPSLTLRIEA